MDINKPIYTAVVDTVRRDKYDEEAGAEGNPTEVSLHLGVSFEFQTLDEFKEVFARLFCVSKDSVGPYTDELEGGSVCVSYAGRADGTGAPKGKRDYVFDVELRILVPLGQQETERLFN